MIREHNTVIFDTARIIINTVDLEYKDFSYDISIRSCSMLLLDTIYELNYSYSILNSINIKDVFSMENVFNLINRYETKLFSLLSKEDGFHVDPSKCSLKYKKWFHLVTKFLNETLIKIEYDYQKVFNGLVDFSTLTFKSLNFIIYKKGIYSSLYQVQINFFKHFYHIEYQDGNIEYFLKNKQITNDSTQFESSIYFFENHEKFIESLNPYLFEIAYQDKFNKIDKNLFKELNCDEQLEVTTMVYGV